MADFETIALMVKEVFVYQIPPRATNKGHVAAKWDLEKPVWKGRLKVVTKGALASVQLLDNNGSLFGVCPVEEFPGPAVEKVTDSSRYFALRLVHEGTGKHAFVGLGFADRGDAFDFTVALQDHFKREKSTVAMEKTKTEAYVPKYDLKMKEGQTFKLNIKTKQSEGDDDDKPKPQKPASSGGLLPPPGGLYQTSNAVSSGGFPALAPPPGGLYQSGSSVKPATASSSSSANPFAAPAATSNNPFDTPSTTATSSLTSSFQSFDPFAVAPTAKKDDWGDFSAPKPGNTSSNWVNF